MFWVLIVTKIKITKKIIIDVLLGEPHYKLGNNYLESNFMKHKTKWNKNPCVSRLE